MILARRGLLGKGPCVPGFSFTAYRGTSLIRKRTPLGPYRRPTPRVLGGSQGGGRFLMGEVPLYAVQGSDRKRSWAEQTRLVTALAQRSTDPARISFL